MTDYSIFFIIAVVATGVGALLFLLSLFGLGEHDLDFDADSGGADVGLLSIKSGIGFFLGFGWGGVLAQGLDWMYSRRTQKAFGTAMRLCTSLSRRRRGPAGLRDLFAFVEMVDLYIRRSWFSACARRGVVSPLLVCSACC